MNRNKRNRRVAPAFESLEGRALLSTAGFRPWRAPAPARVAGLGHARLSTDNSAALQAIMNALNGGAGSEFVKLIRRQVHNPLAVIARFSGNTPYQYSIKGVVAKTPNLQGEYIGNVHDRVSLTVAGAVLLKGRQLELGAIMRGPFTDYNGTSYTVFAINRGAGGSLGPAFASRPGLTPDALVTVTIGPDGRSASATLTDLTSGATQPLNTRIQVRGPVVRLLVDSSLLPSQGLPLKKYQFAAWTRSQLGGGISSVGSFAPENAMIPIGVQTSVRPTL